MNLHIVPDSAFTDKFFSNIQELKIADSNRVIVRSNADKLKFIKHKLPLARLYSSEFKKLTQDLNAYDRIFIHQFTPLLYRWVAANEFRQLNWMIWGADLYNLPSVKTDLYEDITLRKYVKRNIDLGDYLYRVKVRLLHDPYRMTAYSKIDNVLTWMNSEYDFAVRNLPALDARHKFFFYENDLPYQAIDEILARSNQRQAFKKPVYILGNSSNPELNHLDAVFRMNDQQVAADLLVPVSYGSASYKRFLKESLSAYKGGEVRFIEKYMNFQEYLQMLSTADGLIMNNIRPQGYGNIFIMMYMKKTIFLNEKNFSIPDIDRQGLIWRPIGEMNRAGEHWEQNQLSVRQLLSHETLLELYKNLFS